MDQQMPETDYLVWRKFLQIRGDRAMVARLDAIRSLHEAGCRTALQLPDGDETRVPIIVAAEAAVAAQEGQDEAGWRQEWTRRLVRLAVKWQDDLTTNGVVNVLSCTDAVIRDLKEGGVWPWPEIQEPATEPGTAEQ
jgi:hypothetical protein